MNPLRVRQARLEKGLTLAEVAGNDVTRAFISEIEHGKSRPSEHVLRLISARTGKPTSYFLGRVPIEPVRELAIELERVARLIRKVESLRGLTPSEIETFRMLRSVTRFGAKLAKAIAPRESKARPIP